MASNESKVQGQEKLNRERMNDLEITLSKAYKNLRGLDAQVKELMSQKMDLEEDIRNREQKHQLVHSDLQAMISIQHETQQLCDQLKGKNERKKGKMQYLEDTLKYKEQEMEKRDQQIKKYAQGYDDSQRQI